MFIQFSVELSILSKTFSVVDAVETQDSNYYAFRESEKSLDRDRDPMTKPVTTKRLLSYLIVTYHQAYPNNKEWFVDLVSG